jgi:hypothetical protein
MDSAPWYRLHWVTWVVMAVMIAVLAALQLERHFGIGAQSAGYTHWWYLGWPWAHLELVESGVVAGPGTHLPRLFEYRWRWSVLGFNLLACLVIWGSTTYVVESWLRSANRLQFNLRALLVSTGVVAVMLSLLVNSDWLFQSDDETFHWVHSSLVRWDDFQRPLRWPVLVGVAFTIYSLGWLALALLHRAYRLVRP